MDPSQPYHTNDRQFREIQAQLERVKHGRSRLEVLQDYAAYLDQLPCRAPMTEAEQVAEWWGEPLE
jgi:hypothetical protein